VQSFFTPTYGGSRDGTQGNLSRLVRTNRLGISLVRPIARASHGLSTTLDISTTANFAAFIVADRIEVIRESLTPAAAMERRRRHKNDRRHHKLKFKIGF
jgi:hypothetical protein